MKFCEIELNPINKDFFIYEYEIFAVGGILR